MPVYTHGMYVRERKRTERLTLRVTPWEKERIQAAARERKTSVTELMIEATLDKIYRRGFKGTLRRAIENGEAQ